MTDRSMLAAMDVMRSNASSAYFTDADLFVLLILKQVQLAATHGNSSFAANAYELYGMMLCGGFWDCDTGYGFGRLGFEVLERHPAANLAGKMAMIWGTFVAPWKDPARACAEGLLERWRGAVDGGDLEYAAYMVLQSLNLAILSGMPLGEVLGRFHDYSGWLHDTSQLMSIDLFDSWMQCAANLADPERVIPALRGERFDLEARLPGYVEADDRMPIAYASVAEGLLAYFLGDRRRALASLERAIAHEDRLFSSLLIPAIHFYHALLLLSPERGRPDRRARRLVARSIRRMRRWARFNPGTFAHKLALLEAERARVGGDVRAAGPKYRQAIEGARERGFVHDEAVACELYARFWLAQGEPDAARLFLARARQACRLWGAAAKVRELEAAHADLFARIDEAAVVEASVTTTSTRSTSTTTTHRAAAELDLATVLKASQALAGQSSLAPLLEELISIVLENAGADRGMILLRKDGELFVRPRERSADPEPCSSGRPSRSRPVASRRCRSRSSSSSRAPARSPSSTTDRPTRASAATRTSSRGGRGRSSAPRSCTRAT